MNRRPPYAFTLIEMIVVISIIVIAMVLAVPAIRSLTGSRSQEAAQNVLTTALGSVRAEAMAMQRVEGIMFFLDTSSDRIQCVAVMETPYQVDDKQGVTYLDIVPDKDPISFPSGIWCMTMKDVPPAGITPMLPKYRYLGFNPFPLEDPAKAPIAYTNLPGGVILFDSTGRLTVKPYGFRQFNPGGGPVPPQDTAMGAFMHQGAFVSGGRRFDPTVDLLTDWPRANDNPYYLASSIGLCMFDRETFLNQPADPQSGDTLTAWNNVGNGIAVSDYLDGNASPIFVNRYDATLMAAQ